MRRETPQQGTQQKTVEAPQDAATTTYQAPHHKYAHNVPGSYLVKLRGRYSISKHYQFLGRKFELIVLKGSGYFANMDDELLDAVRRDPGVEFVEDNVYGSRD